MKECTTSDLDNVANAIQQLKLHIIVVRKEKGKMRRDDEKTKELRHCLDKELGVLRSGRGSPMVAAANAVDKIKKEPTELVFADGAPQELRGHVRKAMELLLRVVASAQ